MHPTPCIGEMLSRQLIAGSTFKFSHRFPSDVRAKIISLILCNLKDSLAVKGTPFDNRRQSIMGYAALFVG